MGWDGRDRTKYYVPMIHRLVEMGILFFFPGWRMKEGDFTDEGNFYGLK